MPPSYSGMHSDCAAWCGTFSVQLVALTQTQAYQLAPLMMALRQDVIRLLIADDVGIGKTIAGLILREMLDRGEIDHVRCPPHLVEQWTSELESKFSIPATPVTASEAARLEHNLPNTVSIFEAPFTVVSMDFIYFFDLACMPKHGCGR